MEDNMKELKGSQTEKNLWTAFAGESQARNKYDYFASAAKKAGYEQIAAIFQETALNEKEHAKLWFKALGGIGNLEENLIAAAAGELRSAAGRAFRPLINRALMFQRMVYFSPHIGGVYQPVIVQHLDTLSAPLNLRIVPEEEFPIDNNTFCRRPVNISGGICQQSIV